MNELDEPLVARDGVIALWGYGVSVTVSRGHLVLSDGILDARRITRLSKAERPRRIVVVVETGGHVSLDAVRWIVAMQSSSLVLLDRSGVVLAAIGPRRLDDVKLRRAQAVAPWSPAGVVVAALLLATKLTGQASVLRSLDVPQASTRAVESCRDRILATDAIAPMLIAESDAAVTYWREVAQLSVRFAKRSLDRVPTHWLRFGQRQSPIARGNRRAVTPANAMLNFAYAVLEAEVTIALASVGLDPGLGIVHADVEGRASFSLDVLEALRPDADRVVIDILSGRSFSHEDFVELVAGDVRLAPALATELARQIRFEQSVGHVVSRVVSALEATPLPAFGSSSLDRTPFLGRVRAPLSAAQAQALRAPVYGPITVDDGGPIGVVTESRPRRSTTLRVRETTIVAAKRPVPIARSCEHCGVPIAKRRRPHVCEACRPEHDAEELRRMTARIIAGAAAARVREKQRGGEPVSRSEASIAKQKVASSRMRREQEAWIDDGSLDGVDFERDIRPGLAGLSVLTIARAIGASRAWGARIRSGKAKPHRRHWKNLQSLSNRTTVR